MEITQYNITRKSQLYMSINMFYEENMVVIKTKTYM